MRLGHRWTLPIGLIFMMVTAGAYLPPIDQEGTWEPAVLIVGEGAFDTVKDALEAANDYDVIQLTPGVYDEPIVIDKPITLKGCGLMTAHTSTLKVIRNGVTIVDDTFTGIMGTSWDEAGIITRQMTGTIPDNNLIKSLTVQDCTFINCRQGVFLFGAKDSTVKDCDFYGGYRGVTIRGHYMANEFPPTWTSSGNTIEDCNFYDNYRVPDEDGEAVAIFRSNSNTIKGGTMGNNTFGVIVEQGTGNKIEGVTINDTAHAPIYAGNLSGSNTLTVSGCTMRDNHGPIEFYKSGGFTFSGNTITDNEEAVKLRSCSSFTFSTNTMRDNEDDIYINQCSGFTFSSNPIGNSTIVLDHSTTGTFQRNAIDQTENRAFQIWGDKAHYEHTIDTTNTIHGDPVEYHYNSASVNLDQVTAGVIMLAYCDNAKVTSCDVSDADGVWVYNSDGASFDDIDVTNCLDGFNATLTDNFMLTDSVVNASARGWHAMRIVESTGGSSYNCSIVTPSDQPAWVLQNGSTHKTYNSTFDADGVNASALLGGILEVYNHLTVQVWDNGSVMALPDVHVNVTEDGVPIYLTSHFGGTDATTDADGIVGPFYLMDRRYAYSDTATESDHDLTVWIDIDRVWTEIRQNLDMSRPRLEVFEAWDIRAPPIPSSFVVTDIPAQDSIELSWDANMDDTEVYSLYWNITGWTLLENVSVPTTTFRITSGLVNGTEYEFAISAWDEVPLESPWSSSLKVIHVDALAPVAPGNLREIDVNGTNLTVGWDANTEADLVGYNLYMNITGGGILGPWQLVMGDLTAMSYWVQNLLSETTYYFVVTAFDEVPNESPFSLVLKVTTLDITPPEPPVLDLLPRWTNQADLTVTGSAEPDSVIDIFNNGVPVGQTTVATDGCFSVDITLIDGLNLITAHATDGSLNVGLPCEAQLVELDLVPPLAPELVQLPALTNITTWEITGTVEGNTTLWLKLNGDVVDTLEVGEDGTFTLTLDLVEGENVITAFATDRAGNDGAEADAIVVVLDTIAPDVPVIDELPDFVASPSLEITGSSEPGVHVEVLIGGEMVGEGEVDEDGNYSITITLTDRETTFVVRATDLAGNIGGLTDTVTLILDTEAPLAEAGENIEMVEEREVTLDGSGSSDNEAIAEFVWTFTLDEEEMTLIGETVTYTFDDPLTMTVTLMVTDLAGNVASDTVRVRINPKNAPPTLDDGDMVPESGDSDTDFEFSVVYTDVDGDDGRVWVVIDGERFEMTVDPDDLDDPTDGQTFTYTTKLTEGNHSYHFEGKDNSPYAYDAGGDSAGSENSQTTPDVTKRKKSKSPGPGPLLVVAAVMLVAIAVTRTRHRRR